MHRLNLGHLGHEAVHFITHADKGIFYLIKMLAIKPGHVAREYIDGKRKKYFSPLNFFLLMVGIFVFVLTTFHPLEGVDLKMVKQQVNQVPDVVKRTRMLAKLGRVEEASHFMAKYSNYINMAITPLYAFIFYLFFRRSRYNYTEHLVANLYFAGFAVIFFILFVLPYNVLMKGSPNYIYGIYGFLIFDALYRSFAYYQFINKRGVKHYFYALFVSSLIIISWYFISTTAVAYYIEHGFN
ncbi:MAG TPA: DUF3667 domain-containing protein [Chitinophagaceae bacterium]|nr:DUF3667 domain-containing protein [Chitinophagaceae bacterium]